MKSCATHIETVRHAPSLIWVAIPFRPAKSLRRVLLASKKGRMGDRPHD
jgi:hypothetical protein